MQDCCKNRYPGRMQAATPKRECAFGVALPTRKQEELQYPCEGDSEQAVFREPQIACLGSSKPSFRTLWRKPR